MLPFSKTKLTIKSNTLSMPNNLKNVVIKHYSPDNNYSLLGNLSNITPGVHTHF